MTGVVAALKTHHRGSLLGQQVNDLSLALVSPLGSENNDILTHENSTTPEADRPNGLPL